MKLTDVDNFSVEIANCIFGNLRTKESFRDKLFKFVILSCQQYGNDLNFKRQVDNYIEYEKNNWYR